MKSFEINEVPFKIRDKFLHILNVESNRSNRFYLSTIDGIYLLITNNDAHTQYNYLRDKMLMKFL